MRHLSTNSLQLADLPLSREVEFDAQRIGGCPLGRVRNLTGRVCCRASALDGHQVTTGCLLGVSLNMRLLPSLLLRWPRCCFVT